MFDARHQSTTTCQFASRHDALVFLHRVINASPSANEHEQLQPCMLSDCTISPLETPPPGWRFGLRVGLDQRSYSTPGPVSAWMGGRHPDQLSLAIPPRVGTMSTSLRWKGNRMSSE